MKMQLIRKLRMFAMLLVCSTMACNLSAQTATITGITGVNFSLPATPHAASLTDGVQTTYTAPRWFGLSVYEHKVFSVQFDQAYDLSKMNLVNRWGNYFDGPSEIRAGYVSITPFLGGVAGPAVHGVIGADLSINQDFTIPGGIQADKVEVKFFRSVASWEEVENGGPPVSEVLYLDLSEISFEGTAPCHPWHNASLAEDVNGDGFVSAIDRLLVINAINQGYGSGPLGSCNPLGAGQMVDVNNDGYLTAIDSLLIINYINNN